MTLGLGNVEIGSERTTKGGNAAEDGRKYEEISRSQCHRNGPATDGPSDAGPPEFGPGDAAGERLSVGQSEGQQYSDTESPEDHSDHSEDHSDTLGSGRELYPPEDIQETTDPDIAHGQ